MADIQLATKQDLNSKVDNSRVLTDVPANAKFTDTIYAHPTGDGNLHVPATGTANNGKVLKAGATAGSLVWGTDNDTITTINGKTGAISKADIVALGIPAQDSIYTHPSTHPASMITGLPTSLSQLTNDANFINGTYDNTVSGLTATTIKGAIDELKALFDTINS